MQANIHPTPQAFPVSLELRHSSETHTRTLAQTLDSPILATMSYDVPQRRLGGPGQRPEGNAAARRLPACLAVQTVAKRGGRCAALGLGHPELGRAHVAVI